MYPPEMYSKVTGTAIMIKIMFSKHSGTDYLDRHFNQKAD